MKSYQERLKLFCEDFYTNMFFDKKIICGIEDYKDEGILALVAYREDKCVRLLEYEYSHIHMIDEKSSSDHEPVYYLSDFPYTNISVSKGIDVSIDGFSKAISIVTDSKIKSHFVKYCNVYSLNYTLAGTMYEVKEINPILEIKSKIASFKETNNSILEVFYIHEDIYVSLYDIKKTHIMFDALVSIAEDDLTDL